MNIKPIKNYTDDRPLLFGITIKPPKKNYYAPKCWNEVSEGVYKGYDFKLYNNFINGQKGSTLIVLKKAGKWIKSKLKYIFEGEHKTLWGYAK